MTQLLKDGLPPPHPQHTLRAGKSKIQVWSYHFRLPSAIDENCSTNVVVYFGITGSFLTRLLLQA